MFREGDHVTPLACCGPRLGGVRSRAAVAGTTIELLPGQPAKVRLLLGKEDAFRLSRAGIMDPSSASGLTDRVRYRLAVDAYVADVLHTNGLCPRGYGGLDIGPAPAP